MSPLLDTEMVDAKDVFDVNVWGVLEVTQAFSPLLIASKGTIINNGSVVGRIPVPFEGVYNMSKAALEMLSKQMRIEFYPFGVNVIHASVPRCSWSVLPTLTHVMQVVTGGITTNFYAHSEQLEVPETSLYHPGRETLRTWFTGEAQSKVQTSVFLSMQIHCIY